MSESATMNASQAARELQEELHAPAWALAVSAWMQDGKTCLMVRIDPRYVGQVKIPDRFHEFPVQIRRKTQIKAQTIR